MSNIELIWKDFTDEISRLRVLKNIIEHSSEIQIIEPLANSTIIN